VAVAVVIEPAGNSVPAADRRVAGCARGIDGDTIAIGRQFFRVEKGKGEVVIDAHRNRIKSDDAILVPAGARHNVINSGDQPLKLYTLYGPRNHKDRIVRTT
jgi:Cupin domain